MRLFTKIIPLLLFLSACDSEVTNNKKFSDDQVLIEFASKLEEDYHKLHPTPDKNDSP